MICAPRIQLYHDYSTIPFCPDDIGRVSALPYFDYSQYTLSDHLCMVADAVFHLNQQSGFGATEDSILEYIEILLKQVYSDTNKPSNLFKLTHKKYKNPTIHQRAQDIFTKAVQQGFLTQLGTYTVPVYNTQQFPKRYYIHPLIDKMDKYQLQVKYLLGCVGGYKHPKFHSFFELKII